MPILIRQWQLTSEDSLLERLVSSRQPNIMDSSLDDIEGINMIRAYLNATSPESFESRLSEEEKDQAYKRAYSIWISRMEKQVE